MDYRDQIEVFVDDERNQIGKHVRKEFIGLLGEIPGLLAKQARACWELGKRLHRVEELSNDRVRNRCAIQIFGVSKRTGQNYLSIYQGWQNGGLPPGKGVRQLLELLAERRQGPKRRNTQTTAKKDNPSEPAKYLTVLRGDRQEWVDRKKELEEYVLDDASTRRAPLYDTKPLGKNDTEQSIFDSYPAETLYHWYCPAGGLILDPFAGMPIRGVVAALGGYEYLGYELDPKQVERNQEQFRQFLRRLDENDPVSNMVGDMTCFAGPAQELISQSQVDFLIACPPYLDLEPYSKPGDLWHSDDLSNMSEEAFTKAYSAILARAFDLLKPDRFAAFIVQDIRPKKKHYLFRLVSLTEDIAERDGARLHNKAAYVTPYGTAPQRMAASFENSRILTSVHQTVLVFCKGDPKQATAVIRDSAIRAEEEYDRLLEEDRIPVAQEEKRQLRAHYAKNRAHAPQEGEGPEEGWEDDYKILFGDEESESAKPPDEDNHDDWLADDELTEFETDDYEKDL
jgi:hypothetical protein